jgi:biopolymer transport protein ExbD
MRIREPEGMGEPEFSMAPLIDIVFQMLIFFMVATTYNRREKDLSIELPYAQSAQEPEDAPEEIVIDVGRDGHVSVSGRAVERDALVDVLVETSRRRAEIPVTVRGDRLAHHEAVVAVLDACGLAGLSNVSVGTLDR